MTVAILHEVVKSGRLLGDIGAKTNSLGEIRVAEDWHRVLGGSAFERGHEMPAVLGYVRAQGKVVIVVFARHFDAAESHVDVCHG